MERVDVVVVSYNSERHLRRCVKPLAGAESASVIVVDSASTDGSVASIADLPISLISLSRNGGFAYACNAGWRSGAAPLTLFLNPDATIDAESLERLVHAARDERTGAVAPRIAHADGALDYSLRRFPRLRSTYAQALFLHRIFPRALWSDELVRDHRAYERAWAPEWVSGACMLVKRSVLERVGGFDEGFFLYCEDLDLCRRIRDVGFEVRFEPSARAVHEGGASMPRAALLPTLAQSRLRYARKHEGRTVAMLERLGIVLGSLTHAGLTRRGSSARRGHLRALAQTLRR